MPFQSNVSKPYLLPPYLTRQPFHPEKGCEEEAKVLTATFNQDRFPERLSVPTQAPNPESADPRGQRDGLRGGQQTFALLCKTERRGGRTGVVFWERALCSFDQTFSSTISDLLL